MKITRDILLLFTLLTAPVFGANEPIVLEAESAVLGAELAVSTDGAVQYVYPTLTAGGTTPASVQRVSTFSVSFPESGTYELYVRLKVGPANYDDDSFFFGRLFGNLSVSTAENWANVNGIVANGYMNDNDVVDGAGSAGSQVWKWLNVSKFLSASSPVTFTVLQPNSTLTFQLGSREDGLFIDKIAFARADYQFTVKNLTLKESGSDPSAFYNNELTYVNPVMPGDQPDPTLFKDGDDFYASGSSFHFAPYGSIWHSRDLVHWEIVSRVVPTTWSGLNNTSPSNGLWGGTLTYFYGSYWYYFAQSSVQYFSKASSPRGPWSTPVRVNTTNETGGIGYDNSIFVDDDGTPYMLIKPGQYVNRIQKIAPTGHLTGSIINMDWVNTGKKYSWAEGPVMCKRNGWYYYFVAGNVAGGQYVLRSQTLTADSLSWQAMGNFFETVSDANVMFRSPNHITQPFMLSDGTWWTIAHSYESLGSDSWDGKGRQGLLHQIVWDANGKPTGKAASTVPALKPALTNTRIPWRLPRSDRFDNQSLNLAWHFLSPSYAAKYSLSSRPGWLALTPGVDSCNILQRDAGHYYSMSTKVAFSATKVGQEAGLYVTNGNMSKAVKLTMGYNNGKKLFFNFLTTTYSIPNTIGDTVWLRLDRKEHVLTAYYSSDGIAWIGLGNAIGVQDLDMSQPNYNWWVGNCQGLFAKGATAYFDQYAYRDGFATLAAAGRDNYYGMETVSKAVGKVVSNTSSLGGWFMLGGVELGAGMRKSTKVEVVASSTSGGTLEIWMDAMGATGTKLAEVPITSTGSVDAWATFTASCKDTVGQHDLFFRFVGPKNAFYVNTVRFAPQNPVGVIAPEAQQKIFVLYPNPSTDAFYVELKAAEKTARYTVSNLEGKLVEKGQFVGGFNLGRTLPIGTYILRLYIEDQVHSVKLLKLQH